MQDLDAKVIDVDFKDFKNGKYKFLSFFAKKARGMMAAHIIKHRVKTPAGLRNFNTGGYYFSDDQSTPERYVFLRD